MGLGRSEASLDLDRNDPSVVEEQLVHRSVVGRGDVQVTW